MDNSQPLAGLHDAAFIQYVRIFKNLGHPGDQSIHGNRLMGWSMSWIIPALIAYSENCDFIYKEQDCLAFGDWVERIRHGQISYGFNSQMPCEQSLFYIERDTIPQFVAAYMAIPEPDNFYSSEQKMVDAAKGFDVHQFHMLFGRERPLVIADGTWYAQRITHEELAQIREAGLV